MQQNADFDPGNAATDFRDHIPKADMCCSMCQGVPDCVAWVWKDAGLEGEKHRCYLLKTAPQASSPALGTVSGMAPQRPQLPQGFGADDALQDQADDQPNNEIIGFSAESLFCFVLMIPDSGELNLLYMQHQLHTGIFDCDASRVYSSRVIEVAPGVTSVAVASDLKCEFHEIAWNTWVFVAVWKAVIDDRKWESHGWIAKADADAVFMPDRLRVVLRDHASAGWLNNCRYGLHGPLEVFANAAVQRLKQDYAGGDRPMQCISKYPEAVSGTAQWGEDMFMDACLSKVYGIQPEYDERLMCEDHCDCPDWYWCNNRSDRVIYHPFKEVDLYKQCLANALSYTR